MPIPAYRAKQSTDTAGTGTIVLNAAASNARSFAQAFGASSRRVMYAISWAFGFEIGLGDFDGGTPGNLTRATVLASSNAGALVTLPAGTKDVFAVFDPSAREVVAISGTSTLALADLGNVVNFTGSSAATLNLPAVATVPIGAGYLVWNTGTAALTIDPSGAETVNGAGTLALQAGACAEVLRLSTGWMASVPALPSTGGVIGGQLLAAAGSATAPSYAFSGDSDTGAFSGGANIYGVAVGGAQVASFEANQFFYIGSAAASSSFFYMTNLGASASQARTLDVTALNELYAPLVTMRSSVNTDGSGVLTIFATPAGARNSDRRVTRMTIPGSGAVDMVGPVNVSSGGQSVTGDLEASGNLRFNSGYGSAALAFGVRAWVNFNGTGTVAIRASGGVTSITDLNVGDYTVNFNFTMPDANYAVVGNAGPEVATIAAGVFYAPVRTTTSVRVITSDNNTDQLFDYQRVDVQIVR